MHLQKKTKALVRFANTLGSQVPVIWYFTSGSEEVVPRPFLKAAILVLSFLISYLFYILHSTAVRMYNRFFAAPCYHKVFILLEGIYKLQLICVAKFSMLGETLISTVLSDDQFEIRSMSGGKNTLCFRYLP